MGEFGIVDLTIEPDLVAKEAPGPSSSVSGQAAQSNLVGHVDTATVAAGLEDLRKDLTAHIKEGDSGLQLSELVVKLTVSIEGRVAFIAKGAAEASIEVTFARRPR